MKTALVTGSDGFVGRHLVAALETEGFRVFIFDARHGEDIRDYERIRTAVEVVDPDRIYHLAAQAYVPEAGTDPRRGLDVNLGGTLNLLEAVRHTGSRAVVHLAGTSEEYGYDRDDEVITEESACYPTTPYGVSKLAAGLLGLTYARTYGMRVVVTRAYNHTGPGAPSHYAASAFARRIAEVEKGMRDAVEHGNLMARRNYTDVRDIVRAYLLAPDLEPGVYNLCSDSTVTARWVMDALLSQAKSKIPTRENDSLYRPASLRFPTPSCVKFHKLTGWKPEIPLEQTLLDLLNYWRTQP